MAKRKARRKPRGSRPRKPRPYALFDYDNTIGRKNTLDIVLRTGAAVGIFDAAVEDAYQDARIARDEGRIGHHDFAWRIIDLFHEQIRDRDAKEVRKLMRLVAKRIRSRQHAFTRELLARLKERKYRCVLVTGALEELMKPLGRALGFDPVYATRLETKDGRYTGGQIHSPPKDKRVWVDQFLKSTRAVRAGSVAVGDSRADIPMLAAAELAIAFKPDPELWDEAVANGWVVVLEDHGNILVLHRNGSCRFHAVHAAAAVAYVLSLPR